MGKLTRLAICRTRTGRHKIMTILLPPLREPSRRPVLAGGGLAQGSRNWLVNFVVRWWWRSGSWNLRGFVGRWFINLMDLGLSIRCGRRASLTFSKAGEKENRMSTDTDLHPAPLSAGKVPHRSATKILKICLKQFLRYTGQSRIN